MSTASELVLPEGPLVSVAWLAHNVAHAAGTALRIVDIRGKTLPPSAPPPRYLAKPEEFALGHIPGAVFVDWTRDIVDPDDAVPVQIAKAERFAARMGSLGIGDETAVVVYDDYSHMFAGRLHWALRYYGHDAVRILEGGLKAWADAGLSLEASGSGAEPTPAIFTPRPRPELRRTADEVAQAIARGALLIDARGVPQFTGQVSAASRSGHIPTARNVPYPTLLTGPEGAFLPPSELRAAFTKAGIDANALTPEREIIVYCNGGISATVPMTALALLGIRDVALYDGSWNEWGNDASRAIER